MLAVSSSGISPTIATNPCYTKRILVYLFLRERSYTKIKDDVLLYIVLAKILYQIHSWLIEK